MAGGIGCVVDGEIGAPETTRARNVSPFRAQASHSRRKEVDSNANLLLSAVQVVVWSGRSQVAAEKGPLNLIHPRAVGPVRVCSYCATI